MEKQSSSKTELKILRNYFWILLVLWTVLVSSILLWSLFRQKHETEGVARIQARSSFEKDLVYRRWAAGHGGIYVPMTDKTPPNPYLSHVEERDIETPSGRKLTLMNPAYMTRQVHEVGAASYGLRGHITSLNPIRPANAADEWETKALRAFEQGVKEVSSIEKLDNQNYMRLMRPMITEQGCLKCHAEQGYKVGDLRGGISISVPMAPIQAIARGHALTLAVGHFVLWLLGVGGISLGWQRLKRRIQERKYAEEQIESLAKFPSENPNPVLRIAKDGTLLYANDAGSSLLAELDYHVGHIVPEKWRQVVSEVFASNLGKKVEIEHAGRIFSFIFAPVAKADYVNLYGRDITERKQAEEQVQNLAKFPSENPFPVLRIAKNGTVLYANSSGSELLKDGGCEVGARMPEHWHQYVLRVLKSGLSEELETVCCKDRIFSLIIAPVVDAGYVNMYGIDVTERKKAEEDLRKYRQHLEELVQARTGELTEANKQLLQEIEQRKGLEKALLDISEREQRRIGQELHDSLGQQLTGIAFMTKALEQKLAKKLPDESDVVAEISQLVNQATDQARGLAKGLHPVDLDAGTLMSALQELATSTEHLFRVHCTFKCDKPIPIDDAEVVVHLYRITQEAVNNAIKHGRAKNIHIGLSYGKKESVLTVKSDGVDFPKEFEKRGTGMGLQIMDHRVDIIGGSLNIHRAPKGGTIVTCTFPNKNTHNNLEKNYGSEKTAE